MISQVEKELILNIKRTPDYDIDRIDYLNLGYRGEAIKILAKTDSFEKVLEYLKKHSTSAVKDLSEMISVWTDDIVEDVERDTWATINKNN